MKKKIILVTTFIIAAVLFFVNVDEKEVKAADSCDTQVYYYMFLEGSNKDNLLNSYINVNGVYNPTYTKYYKMPDEVDSSEYDVIVKSLGQVDVLEDAEDAFAEKSYMSISKFYETMVNLKNQSLNRYTRGYVNGDNVFLTALPWSKDGGATATTDSVAIPWDDDSLLDGAFSFMYNVPYTAVAKTKFSTDLKVGEAVVQVFPEVNGETYPAVAISITRNVTAEDLEGYSGDSNGRIWLPAIYYVEYEICPVETEPEPEPEKYTVDVEYVDKTTGNRITSTTNKIAEDVVSGTPYSYDCSIWKHDGYTLYTEDTKNYPTTFEGTVIKDETLTCYYTPNKTYNLTVKHYEEGNTSVTLADDIVNKGYSQGDPYTHQCQNIPGYTVSNTSSHPSTLTGTFQTSDITKECYYTRNTYTLTVNYGEDEDCTTLLQPSDSYSIKYKDTETVSVPKSIEKLTNPKLGTFSSQFKTNPELKGTDLTVTMPAKNVSVCIVYTAQTGASWIYLVWVIGALSLGYSIWYFVRYYKKREGNL